MRGKNSSFGTLEEGFDISMKEVEMFDLKILFVSRGEQ